MQPFTLHARPGWGSSIVELQLAWYGLPFRVEDSGDLFDSAVARDKLRPLNPLTQVPVLVLPDGQMMTESAAITLHLADLAERDDLVPGAAANERAAFLRWLVFIVANIYPTFTYADDPKRFVKTEGASDGFRAEVDAYARRLWGIVEDATGAPWFLGERFSALDLYLAVMTRWRPGSKWFTENTPRVWSVGQKAGALERLATVMERNFPKRKPD